MFFYLISVITWEQIGHYKSHICTSEIEPGEGLARCSGPGSRMCVSLAEISGNNGRFAIKPLSGHGDNRADSVVYDFCLQNGNIKPTVLRFSNLSER